MAFTSASSPDRTPFMANRLLQLYAIVFSICWVVTFINTTNLANWITENVLTIAFLLLLIVTHKKFRFSDFSYTLIFIYLVLHIYGAEYTYAENPFGYWLKDALHLQRNHYDRIVHFSFGFMLAYPMRDYFKNWFVWPVWVCWVLPCEITLSFSGMYEIIEWAVADIFFPAEGVAYLGTQGDNWDAQKDMLLAFGGAVLSMFLISTVKSLIKRSVN
jgi:putative membrane protein